MEKKKEYSDTVLREALIERKFDLCPEIITDVNLLAQGLQAVMGWVCDIFAGGRCTIEMQGQELQAKFSVKLEKDESLLVGFAWAPATVFGDMDPCEVAEILKESKLI